MTIDETMPPNPSITNAALEDVVKVGNFFQCENKNGVIFGFICRINNDNTNTISYVRDSLTRWAIGKQFVQSGYIIKEDDFISRVKRNAKMSGAKIPSTEYVKDVLELFKSNFDGDIDEIWSVMGKY